MKKEKQGPREGMVRAAAELLSERGLAGASFSTVLERSGAPRGSIYHHFPDGKDALAAEAIALVGARVSGLLAGLPAPSVEAVIRGFIAPWRAVLRGSGFVAGCAIAAVANERLANRKLAEGAAGVFAAWEAGLAGKLREAGLAAREARAFATLVLGSLEGALVLCRAAGEVGPLDRIEASLVACAPRVTPRR